MGAMAYKITGVPIVYSTVQIKENIKALRHWPLCGEFTDDRWIPRTRASNVENVSIWWRRHRIKPVSPILHQIRHTTVSS